MLNRTKEAKFLIVENEIELIMFTAFVPFCLFSLFGQNCANMYAAQVSQYKNKYSLREERNVVLVMHLCRVRNFENYTLNQILFS